MVIMEPVQNAGGVFAPPKGYFQGVREICDEHGILLCADEVINGFGRLGHWFGSEKYDIRPDMITDAPRGCRRAYASIGAVITTDRVAEPFLQRHEHVLARHHVRRPPGHVRDRAEEPRDHEARGHRRARRRRTEDDFRATLAQLLDLPIVGDIRGEGFFFAIELVRDKETKARFSEEESETLLRNFLSPRLLEAGLICRADDRGDPVIQLSPPLIAEQEQFDEMAGILGTVLEEAWERR